MKPLLLYHQQLQDNSNLIEGRLLLIDKSINAIKNTYIATSGQANYQSFNALATRGRGPIPSVNAVGIDNYTVSTSPIYMPNLKGIEGNFYKIDPHFVKVSGVQRGDFGVHFDANVPGSAGCVVVRTSLGWAGFQADMKNLAAAGFKDVPLLVSYAR